MSKEELIKKYPFLTPNPESVRSATNNIRTELKREFPMTKFSVRYSSFSGGDSVDIRWVDGPTNDAVSAIVDKYQNSHPDFTGDYWDYDPSDFNRVFGGFKYVMTQRRMSEELREKLYEELSNDYPDVNLQKSVHISDFNVCEKDLGFNMCWVDEYNLAYYRFYKTDYTPIVLSKQEDLSITPGVVEIVDYSAKAVAVFGDTKSYLDILRSLGGRFNANLKGKPGWIFPKSKEGALRASFNL